MNDAAVSHLKCETTIKNYGFWAFALLLFFTISMNNDWRTGYLAWYGSLAIVLISYLYTFNWSISIKHFHFEIWLFSFILLGVVSLLWCFSVSKGMDVIKNLIVYLVVIILIHSAINYNFDINTLLRCYFIATLINAVYIILTVDLSQLGEAQLGTTVMEGWNGNGIGFMVAQGALIGWYLFKQSAKKIGKAVYVLFIIVFSFLTIYTGSRTAFIVLVVEFVLVFWLSNPKKILRNIITTAVVVSVVLFVIMNVESFYNVLGSRLEGLFSLFLGDGDIDSSADIRDTFIKNGRQWFLESPLFGYGINNYKVLNQMATGRFTYSHNNFIEMAVNLGVIGLAWYYSIYAYLSVRLVKIFKNNLFGVFLLSSLIVSLVSQYGTVSYYNFYQNFLLMLCFCAINKVKKQSAH